MNILSREPIASASAGTAKSTQPAQTSAGNVLVRTREDIARTREQLANAPEVLAHKLGLPAHVKKKVRTIQGTVHAKIGEVKQHLQKSSETLQDKAGEATTQAKGLTNRAVAKLPAAVVLGVLVSLVLRGLLRRNR